MPQYQELDSRDIAAGFRPAYEEAFAGSWASRVGMYFNSDTEVENYKWLGAPSGMREWVGGRHENKPKKYAYELKNIDFEDTMKIYVADLRRDKTGQLELQIQNMARKAANHWTGLVIDLTNNNGLCYDGLSFFNAAHIESGTAQKNLITVTEAPSANVSDTSAPTATEMAGIILEAVGHYFSITDDQGDPINAGDRNFNILVPTSRYWAAAQQAVTLNNLVGGATNPLTGIPDMNFSVVLDTRLTTLAANNQLVIAAADSTVKPFILQEEVGLTEELKDDRFDNKCDKFGISATRAAGYGLWQKALEITLS